MKGLKVPGLGVAVVHDFRVDWARGYGVRNAQTGEPVTDTTRFQWASVTKPVTAVVALRLVQDGVLDLDRNVNDYLKSWKVPDNEFTREEKVTLRRLLSHDAGVTVPGFRGYEQNEAVPANPPGAGRCEDSHQSPRPGGQETGHRLSLLGRRIHGRAVDNRRCDGPANRAGRAGRAVHTGGYDDRDHRAAAVRGRTPAVDDGARAGWCGRTGPSIPRRRDPSCCDWATRSLGAVT